MEALLVVEVVDGPGSEVYYPSQPLLWVIEAFCKAE